MGLLGKKISETYKSLLRIDDNSNGIDTSLESVTDGTGNKSSVKLSDDQFRIQPQNDDTTSLFDVRTKGGGSLLTVDSSNSIVKAGVGQFNVLTQYAYFGCGNAVTSGNAAGYHYPLYFGTGFGPSGVAAGDQVNHFGNSADPVTTFTTADATDQKANDLVPYLMYVPDNIYIDSVTSMEGADAATGDTTRFHLMSYALTSGSTSCLTDGTLIAHSNDVTNAGSEQIYKSAWTIDSANVASTRVLVCTFEADGNNSDYSYQTIIKYHIV